MFDIIPIYSSPEMFEVIGVCIGDKTGNIVMVKLESINILRYYSVSSPKFMWPKLTFKSIHITKYIDSLLLYFVYICINPTLAGNSETHLNTPTDFDVPLTNSQSKQPLTSEQLGDNQRLFCTEWRCLSVCSVLFCPHIHKSTLQHENWFDGAALVRPFTLTFW